MQAYHDAVAAKLTPEAKAVLDTHGVGPGRMFGQAGDARAPVRVAQADGGSTNDMPANSDSPAASEPQTTPNVSAHVGPISQEEKDMAAKGDVKGFWTSRKAKGDPVADIALKSIDPPGGIVDSLFGGKSINDRLEAFSRVYTGKSADLDAIRRKLMIEHIKAVNRDTSGTPGKLDAKQVYDYHKKVFEEFGLPATTFGGSPFTGNRWEAGLLDFIWCPDCDN